jgi:hypothetical protein
LAFVLEEQEGHNVLPRIGAALDSTLNSLSFQMQCALPTGQFEALDVTEPVRVGEWRDMIVYPEPMGLPRGLFAPATVTFGIETDVIPKLDQVLGGDDPATGRALDWYLKALAAQLQADRFMFLWIATEILSDASGVRVEESYVTRCKHQIDTCPECGESLDRYVQGRSRQAYLEQVFGLTADVSSRIWRMRQMMHGAVPLTGGAMDELSELCSHLQSGLIRELKNQLGLAPGSLPTLNPSLQMSPVFNLGGKREVTSEDLAKLARHLSLRGGS